jgi:NADPH:quinone reductase-like Zn-dependent oxidoreductase
MRKIVIHRPGSYDRLVLETAPDPRPSTDEALVEVEAIGVNYADVAVRMGLYSSARHYVGWPITPGFELAGRVLETGDGVSTFHTDDRVLGVIRFGAYATRVVVPAHQLFRCPPFLSTEQAAAIPTVFLTAHYALSELARPREGQTLLVHSAAGGVGGALVQLGRLAGCRVVGVVGAPHKVQIVRELGAHEVIDKSAIDLWPEAERLAPRGYDAIFDANGVSTLRESFDHLRPTGRLVVYGFHSMLPRQGGRPSWVKLAWDYLRTPRFNPLELTQQNRGVLGFNLSYLFDRTDLLTAFMDQLLEWFEAGELAPPKVTTFALDRVADAHRAIESGQTVGKLVLVP